MKRSVRTPRLTKAVAGKILRNPVHSMNKMAQEYYISARTIRRVVKADLDMKPFKYRKDISTKRGRQGQEEDKI
ncbi:Hypothetical protein FKW44_017188 [Caligus rogercresseyi]|uniref:HTH psq-type domain-containing protein n=1 Tax=Caligus rogercresseyi TaxID=217165 RepID=A0A7T8H2W4_CALRO|nr:Hypothetical protein FKW44_017188 [Caligus rogercresseyi]